MSERNSSTSAVFFADYSQVDAVDSRYRGTSPMKMGEIGVDVAHGARPLRQRLREREKRLS